MKKLSLLLAAIGLIFTACSNLLGNEDKNDAGKAQIELAQNRIDTDYEAGTYSATVTSPYSWRATSHNDWITVKTTTGIAGTKDLEFSVTRNEDLKVREGTIAIKNEDYNLVTELYVIQDAFSPKITVDTTHISFSADGGLQEVIISANCSYEVVTSAEWLSYTKSDNGIIITASISAETEMRSAEITISNAKYEISETISVSQDACPYRIAPNTTSLRFSADGGSQEVVVTANCEYEVSTSAEWLSIEKVENKIEVTVAKSYATDVRSTEIVISNKMYNISEIVMVEQDTKWSKEGSIVGEWKLATWGDDSESSILVYIKFHENNRFDLYQRFSTIQWMHYNGTYTMSGSSLIGVYSDGVAWADEYEVLFSEDAMCLIRKSNNNDISIYTKANIPTHVVEESKSPQESRSISEHRFL